MLDLKILTKPEQWCSPALVYAILVAISIVTILLASRKSGAKPGEDVTMRDKVIKSLWELVWGVIVLYIMLAICGKDYEWVSWVILVFPLLATLGRISSLTN